MFKLIKQFVKDLFQSEYTIACAAMNGEIDGKDYARVYREFPDEVNDGLMYINDYAGPSRRAYRKAFINALPKSIDAHQAIQQQVAEFPRENTPRGYYHR